MQSITETEETCNQRLASQHQLLRERLAEHMKYPGNPILSALQGSGLSVLEAALAWIELDKQACDAYREAFERTGCFQSALFAQRQKQEIIAARILAAKER